MAENKTEVNKMPRNTRTEAETNVSERQEQGKAEQSRQAEQAKPNAPTGQRPDPEIRTLSKVRIKDRADVREYQRIGEVTVGIDANGQVATVDFGGAEVETD